ncbi:plasmid partitioning protein RepB [Mesorhizobium sp. CAU 1741]|uniref:plasmid partitioning protein RepB n=1 Tax=Mesorhizobium sp. CAU 1741 TaxID=3140366 RepID=UPI00325A672B
MNRRSGKSILANFGAFADVKDAAGSKSSESEKRESASALKPSGRVGAGVIGATQRSLSELIEQRDRLQSIVEAGGSIELSPDAIEPSPFPDRLADESEAEFAEFMRSFEENGQKVPIQVRRHPQRDGLYQVVYGHRRWRAAKQLGRAVKAVVVDLDDSELVVAQGIENGQRQDLSWIERALFVATMDGAGIKTKDIRAALSIDDAELAKMRSVCRAVPRDVIAVIGRAPAIGRPRWLELASMLSGRPGAEAALRQTLSDDKVLALASDVRFRKVLSSLKDETAIKPVPTKLLTPGGREFGTVAYSKGVVKIALPSDSGPQFADFLERELPSLVSRFFKAEESGS